MTILETQDWLRTRLPDLKGAQVKSIWSYWGVMVSSKTRVLCLIFLEQGSLATRSLLSHATQITSTWSSQEEARIHTLKTFRTLVESSPKLCREPRSTAKFWLGRYTCREYSDNQLALYTDLHVDDWELEASKDQRVKDWKESPDWIV